jgi:hypothetical protein
MGYSPVRSGIFDICLTKNESMKYCAIVSFILATTLLIAQEPPVKKNEYKAVSLTYSTYAKPKFNDINQSSMLLDPATFDDVQRNMGITLQYSQMNFIQNYGIEYGIGMELMMISKRFNFSLSTNSALSNVSLDAYRSTLATVNIPLHYVHRIELGNRFTLFPKIGVDARVLITNPNTGGGSYTDSLNSLNYSVGFETTQYHSNGPFQNVFLNGMIGASLTWSMKKGGTFGLQLAFSTQIVRNTLLTRIHDVLYTQDGEVAFDSHHAGGGYYYYDEEGNQLYKEPGETSPFLAENKMTSFSVGLSYIFGK